MFNCSLLFSNEKCIFGKHNLDLIARTSFGYLVETKKKSSMRLKGWSGVTSAEGQSEWRCLSVQNRVPVPTEILCGSKLGFVLWSRWACVQAPFFPSEHEVAVQSSMAEKVQIRSF